MRVDETINSKIPKAAITFRNEALDHYACRHSNTIWPQLSLPAHFIYAWVVLGILLLTNIIFWLTPHQIYSQTNAVVIRNQAAEHHNVLTTLLIRYPAELSEEIIVGQTLDIHVQPVGTSNVNQPVSIVELNPLTVTVKKLMPYEEFRKTNATENVATMEVVWQETPHFDKANLILGNTYKLFIKMEPQRLIELLLPINGDLSNG